MQEKTSTKTGLVGADTSFLIDFFVGDTRAQEAMNQYAKRMYISELVVYEFLCGNLTAAQEQVFLDATRAFPSLEVNKQVALIASKLFREQKRKGKPIGHQDALIAATYIAHGIDAVITKNTKHLSLVMSTIEY